MVSLARLADALGAQAELRGGDVDVVGIAYDSRALGVGELFCCLVGEHADGHEHAAHAVARGARALLVERELPIAVPQVVCADARAAMAVVSAAFYADPSRALHVIGVTGTAGKTTTTHLVASICAAGGWPTEVIGTLSGVRTTPEAPEFQWLLAAARARGVVAIAAEVSSHASVLRRVEATSFAVMVFTNLGHDHLDFHGSMDDYFAAKARLFTPAYAARGVVNLDDLYGRRLADLAPIDMLGYSRSDASDVEVSATAHRYRWHGVTVSVAMGGEFNVSNSLAAATTGLALGFEPSVIAAGLAAAPAVPGRFEPVVAGQGFDVVVDFAHTPQSLAGALHTARRAAAGRVIVVFGAGGDRDRAKRPAMGAVAAEAADVVVVTSDNPRSESPDAIIADIVAGINGHGSTPQRLIVEADRGAAIALALREARVGDVVLIAGKGHETTQTTAGVVVEFDDRAVARAVLEELA
jgi:UDP-N-acetylmuramoyl-L-alanyl-D-glutamate--2,6-diaminopimelate ligase